MLPPPYSALFAVQTDKQASGFGQPDHPASNGISKSFTMSDDGLNDIDDELLAMAGGGDDSDSGSEAGDAGDRTQIQSDPASPRSPSEEPKPSVEKVEEEAPSRPRGVAQKVKKRGKKKVSKRELEDELLDLGDDSASESESLRAGAIGGSDDEADAPGSPEEEGPMFPVEGKFHSEQDRRDILALPEIQREEILAERAAEVLKRQQDLQLKKALANAQATANKHKRKAAAADLEDGGLRRGSKKKSALDDYKAARQARGTDRTSRFDRTSDQKDERSPSSASERDADGESEVEWAETTAKSEPPADLKDFERCRVGRSVFAKICFNPGFEETIKGCFARISIGVNRETGQNLYRMAQIKGFKDGKPYSMEDNRAGNFQIDQYVIAAQGSSERPWPFHACSDGKFTLEEFQRYHSTMEKEHMRVPKKSWLVTKVHDINNFNDRTWSEEDINAKLRNRSAMQRKLDPANVAKSKRAAVEQRRAKAEEECDEEELAKCDAELAALENNAMNGNTAIRPKPSPLKASTAKTEQERLAALNHRNRGKTSQDVRTALLAERRKVQMEREKAFKEAKAAREEKARQEALAVPKGDGLNELFGDTPDISRAGTPMSGAGTPRAKRSRAGTPVVAGLKRGSSALGGGLGRKRVEDEVADLGIEVDI